MSITKRRKGRGPGGRAAGTIGAMVLLFLASGCSTGASLGPDLDPACLTSVQVDGRLFVHAPDASLPEGFVPGPSVASVLRNVDCRDTVEPGSSGGDRGIGFERDGDAIGLPVGTTLHPVGDTANDGGLAARQDDGFIVLVPDA